jgi:hypothetical protein
MVGQQRTDPNNAFLWRGNRRRLDLEQMRDTLLAITGELDHAMFGRPLTITGEANYRRTIYAFVERQNLPPIVQTFDFANADTSTPRRSMTTVPQQALFALNSPFMLARSATLASQIARLEASQQVPQLFARVLGRAPQASEREECERYLASGSLEQLAQVLLMSNEVMFID